MRLTWRDVMATGLTAVAVAYYLASFVRGFGPACHPRDGRGGALGGLHRPSPGTAPGRRPSAVLDTMRRLGNGSNAAGIASPVCRASRPTSRRPAGSTQTADGSKGEPSKSTARGSRPSGTNTATVFDVP